MRGPLLERMPPFEGVRAGTAEGDKGGLAITNGLDNSSDNQSLLNDLSSPNNNNISSTHENNESVRNWAVAALDEITEFLLFCLFMYCKLSVFSSGYL